MSGHEEKLKIALRALLELRNHDTSAVDDAFMMQLIACDALCEIQREHYLDEPSPAVRELLVGVLL